LLLIALQNWQFDLHSQRASFDVDCGGMATLLIKSARSRNRSSRQNSIEVHLSYFVRIETYRDLIPAAHPRDDFDNLFSGY
jgi:hypothetical protein